MSHHDRARRDIDLSEDEDGGPFDEQTGWVQRTLHRHRRVEVTRMAGGGPDHGEFPCPACGAAGQIDIRDPTPIPAQDVDGTGDPELAGSPSGVALHVDVDCLRVDGGTAVLGGEVTRSDVTRYVGKYVLLFVQGGARSEGKLTWGFYGSREGVSCGSLPRGAYTSVEIAGGSFKLRP